VDDDLNAYSGLATSDEYAVFTNTYVEPEGIDLTLTEAVTGRWADENKEFLFTVTLADQEGNPLSEYDITTRLPSGTETICTTSDSGVLTFRLKHGQSVVLRDLPKGTSYTITQSEVGSYGTAFTVTGGSFDEAVGLTQSGVLNTEEDGLVEVLNDLGVRDLTVTETVTGNVGDQNKVFPFTVTFTDQAGVPLSGQAITVLLPGETEAVTNTTDAKGTLTFSLKHGQAITFRELPQDICYTITQTEYGDYSTAFTVTGGNFSEPEARAQSGALDGAGNAEVQVVNNLEARNLTITKTVTGNMGERARDFTFTVTLTDQAGDPLGNLDIQTLLPDDTTTVYTTDAKGVVTVTLRHGQSLTLQYLPDDTRYTIAETGAEKYTTTFAVTGGSYTPTKSQTLKGAIDEKRDVTVDVTNDYEVALPTGVTLDTKPFLLLTAGCLGAALVLAQRRRRKLR
jgi:hypothetical protein